MSVQIVVSGNRVIAHGTDFSVTGNTVENKSTGKVYNNATIATVESVPDDIDSVGYEYHAGRFVPCAPYGTGDNNGYFMEVCPDCATPRKSSIPISALKWDSIAEIAFNDTVQTANTRTVSFPVVDLSDYAEIRIVIKSGSITNGSTAEKSATVGDSASTWLNEKLPANTKKDYENTVIYMLRKEKYATIRNFSASMIIGATGSTAWAVTFELQGRKELK